MREYNFIAVRLVNLFKVFQVADNQCSGKNITLAVEFRYDSNMGKK